MTAARRLAAILFADVVGYSRLMGEDESGTQSTMAASRKYRSCLDGCAGRPARGRRWKSVTVKE
jgi:class 3 adenylate cyclase